MYFKVIFPRCMFAYCILHILSLLYIKIDVGGKCADIVKMYACNMLSMNFRLLQLNLDA